MGKNLTVKEVNARVDQLANTFKQCMQEFKDEFTTLKLTGYREEEKSEFWDKFQKFEENINSSLSSIKQDIQNVSSEVSQLKKKMYETEMNRNNYSIVIHGVEEGNQRDNHQQLMNKVVDLFNSKLKLEVEDSRLVIKKSDIRWCYRLGKKEASNKKCRPVVVQFCHRWIRDKVFYSKKNLKGTRTVMTELLTNGNLKLFKLGREITRKDVWTFNGLVYASINKVKKVIRTEEDLTNLREALMSK